MQKNSIINVSIISAAAVLMITVVIAFSIAINTPPAVPSSIEPSLEITSELLNIEIPSKSEDESTSILDSTSSSDETTTDEALSLTTSDTTAVITTKPTTAKPTEVTTTRQEETTTEFETEYIESDISAFVNASGSTISTRFVTPTGYTRKTYADGSFSSYLQNYSLKPDGTPLYLFDGTLKENQTWYAAILDLSVGSSGWQQCADSVIRLMADYMYFNNFHDQIAFDFSSGFSCEYAKWKEGYRVEVNGNKVKYVLSASYDASHDTYMRYLNKVYQYANTSSLKAQATKLKLSEIFPGSFFIFGATSSSKLGHVVIVVDIAYNAETGDTAFLLAQGSTPAVDMHVILNPLHYDDPWYYTSEIIENDDIMPVPFQNMEASYLRYIDYDALVN